MDRRNENRILIFSTLIIAAVASTVALIYTKSALIPFIFALCAYTVISQSISWAQSHLRWPRWASGAAVLLLFLLGLSLTILLSALSLNDFIKGADLYRERLIDFSEWVARQATIFGYHLDVSNIQKEIAQMPLLSWAKNLTGGVLSFIGNFLLVMVFLIFLLAGSGKAESENAMLAEIRGKISRYIATKTFVSMLTGLIVWLILTSCGVDLAFLFASLTVLFNFIPNVGSVIATLLPLPVLLLQFGVSWEFGVVLGLSAAVQFTMGNLIEPKMMGESMDLHPVTILLFLIFWGLVWGIPGMFLAVPITAILKISLARIPATKVFAEILAGRFPKSL